MDNITGEVYYATIGWVPVIEIEHDGSTDTIIENEELKVGVEIG